jgi:putative endonuclease
MAGLVPAIHAFTLADVKGGWVYIMSNRRNGTLYVGVTSNLSRHVWEHREGLVDGFTKQYGLKRLVYYEPFEDIGTAYKAPPSCPGLARASTPSLRYGVEEVDGRAKPGHDDVIGGMQTTG